MKVLFRAFIILGALLVAQLAWSEQDGLIAGRIEIEPPTSDIAELLKESAIRDKVFSVSEKARLVEKGDLGLKKFFLGNPSRYQSHINDIRLQFGVETEETDGENNPSFELLLSVKRRSGEEITLKHANSRRPGSVTFDMAKGGFKRRNLAWFLGEENSSLFVIIPRLSPNSNVRGMLVCPRGLANQRLFTKNLLKETEYRLTGLTASFEVNGHGELTTGRSVGMVRIDLASTINLFKPQVMTDRAYGPNPVVDIRYYPEMGSPVNISVSPEEAVAAIQLKTILHYPVGYKRDTIYTDYVWVKTVAIPKGPTHVMKPGNRAFEVTPDAGNCYAVIYQLQFFDHHYSTEKLEVPDWIKAEPIKPLED